MGLEDFCGCLTKPEGSDEESTRSGAQGANQQPLGSANQTGNMGQAGGDNAMAVETGSEAGALLGAAGGLSEREFLDKFSRQNAAFGAETTLKMTKMSILLAGVNGVGIETAKNLVLQGCGSVTLLDTSPVKPRDCGVNFFLFEADVGKPKQDVIVSRLQELNPLCRVGKAPAGVN